MVCVTDFNGPAKSSGALAPPAPPSEPPLYVAMLL